MPRGLLWFVGWFALFSFGDLWLIVLFDMMELAFVSISLLTCLVTCVLWLGVWLYGLMV